MNHVVRNLTLDFSPTDNFYQSLPLFVQRFKNIENLHVQNPTPSLYSTLPSTEYQWDYLQTITKPTTIQQLSEYHNFAFKYHHSLEYLRVHDRMNSLTASDVNTETYSDLLMNMGGFIKLKFLYVKSTRAMGISCIETLKEFI